MKHLLIFFCFCSSFSFGQLVDATIYMQDAPGESGFIGNQRRVALEVMNDGSIYYFYINNNNNTINLFQYDLPTVSWNALSTLSTIGNNNELHTYQVNGNIYCLVAGEDLSGNPYYHLFRFIPSSFDFTFVFSFFTSADVFNTGISFAINQAETMMVCLGFDFNSTPTLEKYNLTNNTFMESSFISSMGTGLSSIVLDEANGWIYATIRSLFGGGAPELYVSSILQGSFSFSEYEVGGGISLNSFFTGSATFGGSAFMLNKAGTGPDVIFSHNPGGGLQTFKKIMGSGQDGATTTALSFASFHASGGFSPNAFVFGENPDSGLRIAEFAQNGTVTVVGANTNPLIYTSGGQDFRVASNPDGQRVAGYFQFQGTPTGYGNFVISNRAPEVVSYETVNMCENDYGTGIKNLFFSDPEMDHVYIPSIGGIVSSNQSIIDNNDLTSFEMPDGSWIINAQTSGMGSVMLTVYFTDGLDTNSVSIEVQVFSVNPPNFVSPVLQFCQNDGPVDFSDFVDIPDGVFDISENLFLYGELYDFSDIEILNSPETTSVSYEIIDANGCLTYAYAMIEVYASPEVEILSVTPTACGAQSGAVSAFASSLNTPFVTHWSNGAHNTNGIIGLESGAYFINVTDNAGCTAMAQANVGVIDITVSPIIQHVSCHNTNDGSIQLNVQGPNAPYTILWSNGFSVFNISNLPSGAYTAVITDVNGCQSTLTYEIEKSDAMGIEAIWNVPSTCISNDGYLEVFFVNNAVGNISYEWFNQITGASLGTGNAYSGASNGVYMVTVTDDNGCSVSEEFHLNSYDAPYAFINGFVRPDCNLNNGMLSVHAGTVTSAQISSIVWSNSQNGNIIQNLAPNYYSCVVTQDDGCQSFFGWELKGKRPVKPQICMVTVDSTTTTNLVVWEKPASQGALDFYTIYRETATPGEYLPIYSMEYDLISVFNDVVASPKVHSWRYRMSVTDECGFESNLSAIHKTIYLTYEETVPGEYRVTWDNYQGFAFTNYDVLRYTDTQGWEVVAPNMSIMQLPEFIDQNVPAHSVIDYMVEITPPGGLCTATEFKAQDYNSSRSNKARGSFNAGDGTGDPHNNVAEIENESFQVVLYPNPNKGVFTIDVRFEQQEELLSITVLDVQGKVVKVLEAGAGQTLVELNGVGAGMYFVRFQSQSQSELIRIIKE